MKLVVANMTDDDMLAIAAYLSSRQPRDTSPRPTHVDSAASSAR